jgi:hypothetical protein
MAWIKDYRHANMPLAESIRRGFDDASDTVGVGWEWHGNRVTLRTL